MDLFQVPVGTQLHDFNPGIRQPRGLFWTAPVHEDALQADIPHGTASLALSDFNLEDYHNLHNALLDGPSDEASVTFNMTWTATGDQFNVSDSVHQFAGRYSLSKVRMSWSATAPSFTFASDPADKTINVKSVIGRERNGLFFSEG
jgi:hypothetical protein